LGKRDHRVAHFAEREQAFFGLFEPAAAFEGKRHRHKRDHERARLRGDFRHGRRRAAAGAAAHAGDEEHEVAVFDDVGDFLAVGFGGHAAELGIAAGAEAARDAHADEDLVLHRRAREGLIVGVDHRHLQALEIFHLEPIHGIRARAADTDEFDRDVFVGQEAAFEGKFVEIHGRSGIGEEAFHSRQEAPRAPHGGRLFGLGAHAVVEKTEPRVETGVAKIFRHPPGRLAEVGRDAEHFGRHIGDARRASPCRR
jgi:hypothetical protein